jgi:hypothetical protein
MLNDRVPRVPDDWSVWAFSDPHGVSSGLVTALREAGLIDAERRWIAAPKTALIGCGDYVDRGSDSPGVVALIQRLQREASAAGSVVLPALGNHEALMLAIRAGRYALMDNWLTYGGLSLLKSYGCRPLTVEDADRMAETVDACAPGLFEWFETLPEAVLWRDIAFVHGGLVPGHSIEDFGVDTEQHLWIRSEFFDASLDSDDFAAYRAAGVHRVVFGHTPQPGGATFFHEGRSFNIDSNAVGDDRMPPGSPQELTLLGLVGDVSLEDARRISIQTYGLPDTTSAYRPRPGAKDRS